MKATDGSKGVGRTAGDSAAAVLVPVADETGATAVKKPPIHPAVEYFAARLQELVAAWDVRNLETGRERKLTPLGLQRLLAERAPELPVSQTQIYRYFHGQAAPNVNVVYELADLFGVAPSHFVPEEFLPED